MARPSSARDNHIYQFASIGDDPQDKKYADEPTRLIIGDRNTIREFCTFSRGTVQGDYETTMANDNWIMAYVHVAHDCHVGSNTIMANNTTLAGHVTLAIGSSWLVSPERISSAASARTRLSACIRA